MLQRNAFLVLLLAASAWAQPDSTRRISFEAATIKLHTISTPGTGRSGIEETPGLIRIENLSLKTIIQAAYNVKNYQFAGPGWLDTVAFDITAKPPEGYQHEQLQPLVRNLLADRFKLAVHHESKEAAGSALVLAKGGIKAPEATRPRDYFTVRPGLISCSSVTIAELAGALSRMLAQPVVDQTGLTGRYEVKIEWTPEPAAAAPGTPSDFVEPPLSLQTAVNDQLGLKLQSTKVRVDVVVVDHVERTPTEN